MIDTGLNTSPIDIIVEKANTNLKNREGDLGFKNLHYMSNMIRSLNDLQFDSHLVHKVRRRMVKK